MSPFRVIVIDEKRTTSTLVIQLDRSPDVGQTLKLPHGDTVTVRHIVSGHRDGFAGVVLAAPDDRGSTPAAGPPTVRR